MEFFPEAEQRPCWSMYIAGREEYLSTMARFGGMALCSPDLHVPMQGQGSPRHRLPQPPPSVGTPSLNSALPSPLARKVCSEVPP